MEIITHQRPAPKQGTQYQHKETGVVFTVKRVDGDMTHLLSMHPGAGPVRGVTLHHSMELRVSAEELAARFQRGETIN